MIVKHLFIKGLGLASIVLTVFQFSKSWTVCMSITPCIVWFNTACMTVLYIQEVREPWQLEGPIFIKTSQDAKFFLTLFSPSDFGLSLLLPFLSPISLLSLGCHSDLRTNTVLSFRACPLYVSSYLKVEILAMICTCVFCHHVCTYVDV